MNFRAFFYGHFFIDAKTDLEYYGDIFFAAKKTDDRMPEAAQKNVTGG